MLTFRKDHWMVELVYDHASSNFSQHFMSNRNHLESKYLSVSEGQMRKKGNRNEAGGE